MQGRDFYSGSALGGAASGAASGAMAGSMVWPGYGTLIGGLLGGGAGLLTGASANSTRDSGVKNQQQVIANVQNKMRQASADNYAAHLANLNKALAMYGPATQRWNYLYGTGTGQGNFPTTPQV
jgi:hypothetical protein